MRIDFVLLLLPLSCKSRRLQTNQISIMIAVQCTAAKAMRLGVDVGENRFSRFLEIAIKAMELAPELTFWQLKVFLFLLSIMYALRKT